MVSDCDRTDAALGATPRGPGAEGQPNTEERNP
jgi:hypothetical protein